LYGGGLGATATSKPGKGGLGNPWNEGHLLEIQQTELKGRHRQARISKKGFFLRTHRWSSRGKLEGGFKSKGGIGGTDGEEGRDPTEIKGGTRQEYLYLEPSNRKLIKAFHRGHQISIPGKNEGSTRVALTLESGKGKIISTQPHSTNKNINSHGQRQQTG